MGGDLLEFNNILFSKEGSIAYITMNREESLNALNLDTIEELDKALDIIQEDDDVYLFILTGRGRAFVAGADILEMKELNSEGARKFAEIGQRVFRKIELMEKPSIAAVNGFALGGGCELSMACDIRIASNKAKFGQPETGLGVTPGFSGTNRLSRLVGLAKAKELIFTCDIISAEEAFRIGLVNMVVDSEELMDRANEMAAKIISKGQLAIRYSKTAINRSYETDIETGNLIEKDLFGLCFATEDQKEGMRAFVEKRKPDFKLK